MKIDDYLQSMLGEYWIKIIYSLLTCIDDAEHLTRVEARFMYSKQGVDYTNRATLFHQLVRAIKLYKVNCIALSKQPALHGNIHIYYIPSFVPMSPNENPIKVMEIES